MRIFASFWLGIQKLESGMSRMKCEADLAVSE
jgi:hypothetical protein